MPTQISPNNLLPNAAFDFFSEKFKLFHYCVNDWVWTPASDFGPTFPHAGKAYICHLVFKPAEITTKSGIGFFRVESPSGDEESKPKVWSGLLNGFGVVREFGRRVSPAIVVKALELWKNINLTTQAEHGDVKFMCAPEKADFSNQEGVFTGFDRDVGLGRDALIRSPLLFGYFFTSDYPAFTSELINFCEEKDASWDRSRIPDWGICIASSAFNFPIGGNVLPVHYARKKRFAGRTDLPVWREQHRELLLGRKFRKQQKIVEQDNQAGGRGRLGTGVAKLVAKVGKKVTKAMLKAASKHLIKKHVKGKVQKWIAKKAASKVTGKASKAAGKLIMAALGAEAVKQERRLTRTLKATKRIKQIRDKAAMDAKARKQKDAAKSELAKLGLEKEVSVSRELQRQRAEARRQIREVKAQRKRWLKNQAKVDRERKRFARQVAQAVKDADKRALRKLSFRQKRPCFPTQQRRRPMKRRRRRLTSKGTASRRRAPKRKRALGSR